MRLLKLHAKNIFSIGEIELDLDRRGLLLVTGHSIDEGGANGSGKSSISNKAVLWGLYGASASGERADAVINRFAPEGESSFVTILLESRSGSHFNITRGRSPNRLSLVNVDTNEDISCKQEKDTQAAINKILGRNRETFLQTDMFGQGKAANFLDLTPKAQVELLETILPFEQINELAEQTKKNREKVTLIEASVNRHISEAQGKVFEGQQNERKFSEKVDSWERQQEANLTRLKSEIVKEEKIDNVTLAVQFLQKEIESIVTKEEANFQLDWCKENMADALEFQREYTNAQVLWQVEKDMIVRKPKPPATPNCPTCKVPMPQAQFEDIVKDYEKMEQELKEADNSLAFIRNQLIDCTERQNNVKSHQRESETALKKHAEIELKLAKLEADRATNKLAILKESLAQAEANVNPYVELYTQSCANLNTLVSGLGFHKRRLEEILKDKIALEFWQGAFNKELKNEMIKGCCNFLQERAIIHLEGLGNAQIKVQVGTTKTLKSSEDRSEFNVAVSSIYGGATYEALSGGERQIVNFAFGLALADLAEIQVDGPSYIMILDEIFMALDARNSENLVNYLNTVLSKKKETILLVSNEESLKSLIPNKILVIKENGISRLENV